MLVFPQDLHRVCDWLYDGFRYGMAQPAQGAVVLGSITHECGEGFIRLSRHAAARILGMYWGGVESHCGFWWECADLVWELGLAPG